MHPALSIILFTTLSGAGYGLAAITMGAALAGGLTRGTWLAGADLAIAAALIGGGLMISVLHLRRPARARFAFSQWRSSWLSREGILSVATLLPLALFWAAWLFLDLPGPIYSALAVATIAGAAATVVATGMIYASLPPIREWRDPRVVPVFLALGLQTGSIWFWALAAAGGKSATWMPGLVAGLSLAVWALKASYWQAIDRKPPLADTASALGLHEWRDVAPLDPTQTGPNYVRHEMGFQIARKHSRKLRRIGMAIGGGVPLVAALAALLLAAMPSAFEILLAVTAVAAAMTGALVERWLFFAEATHTAMLYY